MQKEHLVQAIDQRAQEVAGYQTNIDNYTRMVAKIAGEWCALTSKYKGMDSQQVAASITDDAVLIKVSDLNFRDKLTVALRAERMEQRKAMLVMTVLQDQLREI